MPDRRIGTRNAAREVVDESPGPWKKWRTSSRARRAIRFIETYCRPSKGTGHGRTLKLHAFQRAFIEDALADGIDVGLLSMPRGNGKSTLVGAIATWAVFDDDSTGAPQVPIIATTISQAARTCYGAAVSFVRNEPELRSRALIYTGIATPRIVVPFNEGELFPISNDVDGLQGLDPSLAIVDEVGFQPLDAWDSLRLAAGKRERSLTLGLGTPGLDRHNALWHLRSTVRDKGKPRGLVFHEHAAPDDADIADRETWRSANPALRGGFLRMAALETDYQLALTPAFRTFHLGQWVTTSPDSWLGADASTLWRGLTDRWDLRIGAPTWVGVDMALKRDTSAVVMVQQRGDKWHAHCRVWAPTTEQAVDATDVMQYLRDRSEEFDVRAISYDPRFFDVPAKYLEDEGLPMVEVPQSVERMTMAVGGLYEAITKRLITHDGDEVFTNHVLNAIPRFNDRGFTLAKAKSRGHIDAAIALALAYDRVQRSDNDGPSVYETRGVLMVGAR